MKLFLLFGLLSVSAICCQALPQCHLNEMRTCLRIAIDYLHSLPRRQIPESEDDVDAMCNEINKAMDCAISYRDRCTTPLQKELITLTLEGTEKLITDFCSPGSSSRTKYLAHSTCLNEISQMDEVKEQIEYILAVLEKASNLPENEFISFSCCGYANVHNTFLKLGKDHCGEEAVEAAEELISIAIAQFPEVICGGFKSEDDRCQENLPPAGAKPSTETKETAVYQFIYDILKNWLD